jgi:prepilin peptidase CpaA
MPGMAAFATLVTLAAYGTPLALAAFCDARTLRIPNVLVAIFALLYAPAALLAGHAADLPAHAAAGLLVLLAGAPLFAFRLIGGGDVKLLSAAALWLGFAGLRDFLLVTALLGGLFALALLVARRIAKAQRAPIPYAVPIAAAGLLMAPSLSLLH